MTLGSTGTLTEMRTRFIAWGNCGQCVWLTILSECQPPGILRASPGLYRNCFAFF